MKHITLAFLALVLASSAFACETCSTVASGSTSGSVAAGSLTCDGFHWAPELGRGEYLFVIPHVKEMPQPVVVERVVEKKIFVEVPVKPKHE